LKSSCGPNPGSRRQSSCAETSPGTTLIFSPARTTLALAVLCRRGSRTRPRPPSTSRSRSVSAGWSRPRRGSATGGGSSDAPADLLLGNHDRIEAPPGDIHRETAELAKRVANAAEEIGMRRDQVVRTEVAAGLLVRQQTQD